MKPIPILLLAVALTFLGGALEKSTCGTASSVRQAQPSEQVPTIASDVDRDISRVEKEIVEAAEAMPADKFNFSPESLNIPGSNFKGVRTFSLLPNADGSTEFSMKEEFSGLMLPLIKGSLPDFAPVFETYAGDLKRAAEGAA